MYIYTYIHVKLIHGVYILEQVPSLEDTTLNSITMERLISKQYNYQPWSCWLYPPLTADMLTHQIYDDDIYIYIYLHFM